MLGLYAFNALPIGERASVLWEHGTFIVASGERTAIGPPCPRLGSSPQSTFFDTFLTPYHEKGPGEIRSGPWYCREWDVLDSNQ
jgi:hypothetical protein